VDNPSNSRADGAYDRALAAYQEKSYEVARRWTLEALAYNRQHSGARALLGRLDAAVRPAPSPFQSAPSGSEVVSTDPTVLISRASQPSAYEPVEPTVMVRPDDPRRRPDTDSRAAVPPANRPVARPQPDPTVVAQSNRRASSSRAKSSFSLGAALQSLGERFQGRGSQTRQATTVRGRSSASGGSWISTPTGRGAIIAVATVAVGALLIWGVFGVVRWIWPAGQLLTVTKPVGGTITGPGIKCGTRGSDCSTTVATGQAVVLEAENDKDYVFSGFTDDCARLTGRTSMTQPRTCGATFDPVANAAPAVTFRLTITKPEGGTVVSAPGILCGANGSTCSAEIPTGAPVTLKADAAEGFVFDQFTGDCPGTGEMTMTSAKTCGATFIRTAVPIARGMRPSDVAPIPPRHSTPSKPASSTPQRPRDADVPPAPSGPTPAAGGSGAQGQTQVPTTPTTPAAPPISADDHAKQEIQLLVKNYCSALETLKSAGVRRLFHLDNEREYKERFKEYKSLKCTVTSEKPEYARLDSSEAGAAQLKFDMKQVIEMRSGGAPKAYETTVTMVVSRKNFQSPWLIDRLTHEEKPK
jgi:hypothetical protein